MTIISWNISGVGNKLDRRRTRDTLSNGDIIFLNETKTDRSFGIPGYYTYRTEGAYAHRGGCAVLLRNYLNDQLVSMDICNDDRIVFELKCVPNVLFVAAYIPPTSSPYFDTAAYAAISAIAREKDKHTFVLGDLNTRFGNSKGQFLNDKMSTWSYVPCKDKIGSPNANARIAISSLNTLVLVNDLNTGSVNFPSDLTFRQSQTWISELDCCFISPELVTGIIDFSVNHDLSLPSSHAPIAVTLDLQRLHEQPVSALLDRSAELGSHVATPNVRKTKQYRISDLDVLMFTQHLNDTEPPLLTNPDIAVGHLDSMMQQCLTHAKLTAENQTNNGNANERIEQRWKKLLEANDSRQLWNAIDWSGKVKESDQPIDGQSPTDEQFKAHFEALLNPNPEDRLDLRTVIHGNETSIPITDDLITEREVTEAIRKTKSSGSGGPSGVPAGILHWLTPAWVIFLVGLFNTIFFTSTYPIAWCRSRLVTIFKSGSRSECGNYRGIAVMDCFAKLFDAILCTRLSRWFKPDREQAGSQPGRGCMEHIVTLRLLMDLVKYRKRKLFLIFVDFSKAYDRVPHDGLLRLLKALGCGIVMLNAIAIMYSNPQLALGSAVLSVSLGVRQGAPTSCFLFTLFVNPLIRILKTCAPDGFLVWLHCLMLMDDTIILATDRQACLEKFDKLLDYCESSGMIINSKKTKLMVVNGTDRDRAQIKTRNITVDHANQYVYLGATFTEDGSVKSAVAAHARAKASHIMKFASFLQKNCDFPFPVKQKVFESALLPAIMYSCEAWLSGPSTWSPVAVMVRSAVKSLLGVRVSTPNDLCYVELGISSLESRVRQTQAKFFRKMLTDRRGMADDPFWHVWELCKGENTPAYRYIINLVENDRDWIADEKQSLAGRVRESTKTKTVAYRDVMNPTLSVHPVYTGAVPEYKRIAFSRFRLFSHNMIAERARWTSEDIICECGDAPASERHLIFHCKNKERLRIDADLDFSSVSSLWECETRKIVDFIYELF